MSLSFANIPFNQLSDRLSLDRLKSNFGHLQSSISSLRPIQEFFDFRRVSKPNNFGEVQNRVSYNLNYYSANYLIIVSLLSVYALVTNMLLLFVIVFAVGGAFGISKLNGEDLVLPVGRFSTSQLYTALCVVAFPLCIFASPISTFMWLIGSSGVSVLAHASLMEKPIETVFEDQV